MQNLLKGSAHGCSEIVEAMMFLWKKSNLFFVRVGLNGALSERFLMGSS
jgi:hypothetical protein